MLVNRWQCFYLPKLFWLADRLPWFARKRALNALVGREAFTDLMQSDGRGPFEVCIKW